MTKTDLPDVAIGRAALAEIIQTLNNIEDNLSGVPYGIGVSIVLDLNLIRSTLLDRLPGGDVGECVFCYLPIGADEISGVDNENGGAACKFCMIVQPVEEKPEAVIDGRNAH